ncbi:hypothetical protein ECPA39_4050, partial [Escherichia coli PA39]
MYQLLVISQ